jgi:hypothetical protein
MICMRIEDNDADKLDLVLGQAHCVLGENGDVLAQSLLTGAALTVRRDGGIFYPIPRRQLERVHIRGCPGGCPLARAGIHHRDN